VVNCDITTTRWRIESPRAGKRREAPLKLSIWPAYSLQLYISDPNVLDSCYTPQKTNKYNVEDSWWCLGFWNLCRGFGIWNEVGSGHTHWYESLSFPPHLHTSQILLLMSFQFPGMMSTEKVWSGCQKSVTRILRRMPKIQIYLPSKIRVYYVNTNINNCFAVEELGYIRSEGDIKVVAFHSLKPHCLHSPSWKIHVCNIKQVMNKPVRKWKQDHSDRFTGSWERKDEWDQVHTAKQ
jgi:hypothetical protein